MIYKEKAETRIDDFDADGYMLLPSVLKVLENAADHHSASVTDESVEGSMRGVAWILAEWRVEVIKLPSYRDTLVIETWISEESAAAHSNREFLLLDDRGNVLIKAAAKLTLFDLKENRIIKTDRAILERYRPEGSSVFSEKAHRLIPAESFSSETVFPLRRSDIDYNGHVHNTSYLNFVFDILPENAVQSFDIAKVRIAYKRPIKLGDNTIIKFHKDGGVWNVCVFGNDVLCAIIELTEREDLG